VQFWAPDDGWKTRLKHVQRLTEINKLWNVAFCWLCSANILAMHGPTDVKFALTSTSQFIYFCKTLYMFQTGFPSIRSTELHIQRQAFVRSLLLPAASLLTAGSSNLRNVASCWLYSVLHTQRQVLVWQIPDAVCAAPDDGWKIRLKHVRRLTEINKLWNFESYWLYSANILAMHWPMNVKNSLITCIHCTPVQRQACPQFAATCNEAFRSILSGIVPKHKQTNK